MSNEVIKETEETAAAAASVKEETQLDNSVEVSTEDEQSSGEMDFGAILEQFEQEQTLFSSVNWFKGRLSVSQNGEFWLISL